MGKGKERIEKIKRGVLGDGNIRIRADFALEMSENRQLLLSGCLGIAEYGDCSIGLHVYGGSVNVCGRMLLCDSYTNGAVVVSGYIDSVSFSLKEGKK